MAWDVEYTDEFGAWWESLTEAEQESVAAAVELLQGLGPHLRFPFCSDVKGSRHGGMRELRKQHQGRPLRMFYVFDPRRVALLLVAGDKTGDDRFYERMVPLADRIYDAHLEALTKEGRHG